jgi:ABC-2 type transport system permease protein
MTVAIAHTSAVANRHVRTFIRQPWWIAISLMQPLIYLLLFGQLFQTVGDLPAFRGSYLDFLLPGVVAMSALSSGGWAGMTSIDDISVGIMGRMLVTPASRAAIILGHLAQGALILILQTLILVGVGALIGARFDGGLPGIAVMLLASLLLGSATGALSHGIGFLARTRETLIAVSQGIILPMTFLSTTFMVPDLMPDWMAAVAGFNPLTWAADASRAALDGTGDAGFIGLRIIWLALFLIVSVALALRAFGKYRRSI